MADPLFDRPSTRTLVDEQGQVVCARCAVAERMLARMRGLLGRKGLEQGQGLLIPRTRGIHTFFMAFPIDVVFLDREFRVRSLARDVRPSRAVWRRRGKHVIELAAGESDRVGIRVGSRLAWRDEVTASA